MENTLSEIVVSYNPPKVNKAIMTTPESAKDQVMPFFDKNIICLQEQFLVMYVNRNNQIIGMYKLSKGGLTGTVADIRLILGVALKCASCSVLLAHNHPSGNTKPSQADLSVTAKIKEAATLMDIRILDHLIIAPDGEFTSMGEEGLL